MKIDVCKNVNELSVAKPLNESGKTIQKSCSKPNEVNFKANRTALLMPKITKNSAWLAALGSLIGTIALSSDFLYVTTLALILSTTLVPDKKKNLPRHIEFKEASTIDEAKQYAKDKLGIKKMDIDNLEYANLCNEALTNVSNKFGGKVHFPKKIKFGHILAPGANGAYKQNSISSSIVIDKKRVEKVAAQLDDYLNCYSYEGLTSINYGDGYEEFCDLLKKAYQSKYLLTEPERYALALSIANIKQIEYQGANGYNVSKNKFGNVYVDKHHLIYHELGHCFDCKSSSILMAAIKTARRARAELSDKILPEYSKSRPSEFVAEIFAGIMQGKTFPDDIMNLFRKYTKMELPQQTSYYA